MEESGVKAHATDPDGTSQRRSDQHRHRGRRRRRHAQPAARAQRADHCHAGADRCGVRGVGARSAGLCGGDRVGHRSRLLRRRRCARDGRVGQSAASGCAPLAGGGVCAQLAARLLHQAHRVADRRRGDGLGRGHHALRHAQGGWRALSLRHAGNGNRPVSRRRGELGVRADAGRDRHVPGADGPCDRAG